MRRIRRRVLRFARLPAAERGQLVQAGLLLAVVRAGLWLLPFATVRRMAARAAVPRPVAAAPAARLAWAVAAASRYVPKATCLTQALAGQVLLARHGHAARVHIGVAQAAGKFEAHAWLESEAGVVLGGGEAARYTQLLALEAGQR